MGEGWLDAESRFFSRCVDPSGMLGPELLSAEGSLPVVGLVSPGGIGLEWDVVSAGAVWTVTEDAFSPVEFSGAG